MDTSAYLTRQGWLGTGHALNPTTGRGLAKPLLVTPKPNVLGLGKRKHDAHADQWWARAFDATLKQLNVGCDEAMGVTSGSSVQLPRGGDSAIGLYRHFVRGEGLEGTQAPQGVEQPTILCLGSQGAGDEVEAGRREEKRRRKKRKTGEGAGRALSLLTQPEILAAEQDEGLGEAVSKYKKRRRRGLEDGVEAPEGRTSKMERLCVKGMRASKQAGMDCQSQEVVAKDDDRLEDSRKRRKRKKKKLEMDTI